MKITANCLVKNEENFIWFAVNSVIDYVDEMIVWDNGSRDRTIEIVNLILKTKDLKHKIKFEQKGETNTAGTAKLRQQMLEQSDCDWLMILDGDEIWHSQNLKSQISNLPAGKAGLKTLKNIDLIVNPAKMLIGDIFHYQEEQAGRYKIGDRMGHFNIRFIRRNIPGLHIGGVYPNEAFVDEKGVKVQDYPEGRMLFSDQAYLHTSLLPRSSLTVTNRKVKYEIGQDFPLDYQYPDVFFRPRPDFVPSPWKRTGWEYKARAYLETPLKKLKRRLVV